MNKTPSILIPALRQYRHNSPINAGYIAGFDYEETCKIVRRLEEELRKAQGKEWIEIPGGPREFFGYLSAPKGELNMNNSYWCIEIDLHKRAAWFSGSGRTGWTYNISEAIHFSDEESAKKGKIHLQNMEARITEHINIPEVLDELDNDSGAFGEKKCNQESF